MPRKKVDLCVQQANRCFYCDERFDFDDLTIDHFVPRSLGGKEARRNLVLACQPCNYAKGSNLPTYEEIEKWRVTKQIARATKVLGLTNCIPTQRALTEVLKR